MTVVVEGDVEWIVKGEIINSCVGYLLIQPQPTFIRVGELSRIRNLDEMQ